jgi:hypothetical protein
MIVGCGCRTCTSRVLLLLNRHLSTPSHPVQFPVHVVRLSRSTVAFLACIATALFLPAIDKAVLSAERLTQLGSAVDLGLTLNPETMPIHAV